MTSTIDPIPHDDTEDEDAYRVHNGAPEEDDDEEADDVVDEFELLERERQYFSEDEADEGEDLTEKAELDYRKMATLDHYDPTLLDTRQYEDMDVATRRAVEEELNRRDARHGRLAQAFVDDQAMEYDDAHRRRVQRREDGVHDGMDDAMADEASDGMNLEHFDVPLREWIATERPRQEIQRRFRHFLQTFHDRHGHVVYHAKIVQMAQRNGQSLAIAIGDVIQHMSLIAAWIVEAPREMLRLLDDVARDVVLSLFPYYHTIHAEIYVRILDLPGTERLRDLRTAHLNFLIKVTGVVTRRTSVFPQLQLVKVNCLGCGVVLGPFTQHTHHEVKVTACPECHYRGHFPVNSEQTVYRNFQKLTLQEAPGSVPPGRVPRSKDVVVLSDLIDQARPGDEIAVTGIYTHAPDPTLNGRDGFPVFRTIIEANHIERRADVLGSQVLTADDKKHILRLAKAPDIAQRIIHSIAPSIYGHVHVKTALALALFGGKPKFIKNSRVRGDLNVLLVGDPGTAKSQFLKFVQQTAPRAVYSTGKGASAVGLTAGVSRDPFTKEWVLQGGALVLADQGVCLIDEFDKMNEQDRTSIHEAMEQQSISVSKAGIVTSLQARCAVIAAANPIGGRYNAARTFAENVELTDPILQRFDLLCVLQDKVDPVDDERLADFVVTSHMQSHPTKQARAWPADDPVHDDDALSRQTQALHVQDDPSSLTLAPDLLRKYILYARTFVTPVLASNVDTGKIEAFYAQLRRASQHTGAVPIAVRHLESIFRMAEAHARMHLRESVSDDDVALALRVLTESLCAAQKFTFQRQWRRLFRPYLTHCQDNNVLLLHVLHDLFQSAHAYQQLRRQTQAPWPPHATTTLSVLRDELVVKAKAVGIDDLSAFYDSSAFRKAGFRIDEASNAIVKDV